jgi:large subunit ribosomal protein L24
MEKWGIKFGKIVPKVKDVVRSWKIFTGDTVRIMEGDEKGKEGKVQCVLRKRNLVVVSGLNLQRVNMPAQEPGKPSYYTVEKGINVSYVSLIDPTNNEPCKAGWQLLSNGSKKRVSRSTGAEIPLPPPPEIKRVAGPFDTNPEDVHKRTYFPSLKIPPLPEDCTFI